MIDTAGPLFVWTGKPMQSAIIEVHPGDVVRHVEGRRHWAITRRAGQLVDVVAVRKPERGEPTLATYHAAELVYVKRGGAK